MIGISVVKGFTEQEFLESFTQAKKSNGYNPVVIIMLVVIATTTKITTIKVLIFL